MLHNRHIQKKKKAIGLRPGKLQSIVLLLAFILIFTINSCTSVIAMDEEQPSESRYVGRENIDSDGYEQNSEDENVGEIEEDPEKTGSQIEEKPDNNSTEEPLSESISEKRSAGTAGSDNMIVIDEASGLPLINSELPPNKVRNLLGSGNVSFTDYPIMYMDEYGDFYTHVDCIPITGSEETLGSPSWATWYYVPKNESISWGSRVSIQGAVTIVLCNGASLDATNGGISVLADDSDALTIYAQTSVPDTMGSLTAKGTNNCAGIGGDKGANNTSTNGNAGKITINGGKVTATGDSWCAGIGGGNFGKSGEITINAGIISANGSPNYGAGIGSGTHRYYESITINGGTITAKGGNVGAGIGNGGSNNIGYSNAGLPGTILITGGTVTATGGTNGGAGIGGAAMTGAYAPGETGTIIIKGGTITAKGGGYGSGIGGGAQDATHGGAAGTISITGGTINATGGSSGNGIGGGSDNNGGSLSIDWSDMNDPTNGLPEITASNYMVDALSYVDENRTFRKKDIAGNLTSEDIKNSENWTIVPSTEEVTVTFVNDESKGTVDGAEVRTFTTNIPYGDGFPSVTAKQGYVFTGWFTADSRGTKVTKDSIALGNVNKLYAKYALSNKVVYEWDFTSDSRFDTVDDSDDNRIILETIDTIACINRQWDPNPPKRGYTNEELFFVSDGAGGVVMDPQPYKTGNGGPLGSVRPDVNQAQLCGRFETPIELPFSTDWEVEWTQQLGTGMQMLMSSGVNSNSEPSIFLFSRIVSLCRYGWTNQEARQGTFYQVGGPSGIANNDYHTIAIRNTWDGNTNSMELFVDGVQKLSNMETAGFKGANTSNRMTTAELEEYCYKNTDVSFTKFGYNINDTLNPNNYSGFQEAANWPIRGKFKNLKITIGSDCAHEYEEDDWESDKDGHWHICEKCGSTIGWQSHSFGTNNICTICGFKELASDSPKLTGLVIGSGGRLNKTFDVQDTNYKLYTTSDTVTITPTASQQIWIRDGGGYATHTSNQVYTITGIATEAKTVEIAVGPIENATVYTLNVMKLADAESPQVINFDGREHGLTVKTNAPGTKLKYGITGADIHLDNSPTVKAVGDEKTIWYTASAYGLTVTGYAMVRVTEAASIRFLDVSVGADHNVTTSVDSCNDYTIITEADSVWGTAGTATWYVVYDEVELLNRVRVQGDVHLIISNDGALVAKKGIEVPTPVDSNKLTIYQQPEEKGQQIGKMIASAALGSGNAGIGGNDLQGAGSIVINGGEITATGARNNINVYNGGAGIGGGRNGGNYRIIINYGNIKADNTLTTDTNNARGAGIGSGGSYPGGNAKEVINNGTVEINGGSVSARGGSESAGIGGGETRTGGTIDIYGGTVTAEGFNRAAGIGGGWSASGGDISIYGGRIEAKAGTYSDSPGAAIGGGGQGSHGANIYICGGKIIATESRGAGIGGGGTNNTASIRLDWRKYTFDSTEITACSYKGVVTFERPYILKTEKIAARLSNINGNTIIPGIIQRMTLIEGRRYEDFDSDLTELSIPAETGFTANLDYESFKATAEELDYVLEGYQLKFSKSIPEGTVLTLTAISGSEDAPIYKQYYAIAGADEKTFRVSSFAERQNRGVLFKPSSSDRDYLVSVDFPEGIDYGNYQDVGIELTALYKRSDGESRSAITSSECTVSVTGACAITANGTSVTIVTQPSGTSPLQGKTVFLVAMINAHDSDENSKPLDLQTVNARCNTSIEGKWISTNVVAFEIGIYGTHLPDNLNCSFTRFEKQYMEIIPATLDISWTLCTETSEMNGSIPAGYLNPRANAISNTATSTYTIEMTEFPYLSASLSSSHKHLLRNLSSSGETLMFAVATNRPYRVWIEKQIALHAFNIVNGSASSLKDISEISVGITIPNSPGTYRVCFSMDAIDTGSKCDNVYETFIVE